VNAQQPQRRRRIAGEAKPGDASPAPAAARESKPKLPKLPKRPKAEQPVPPTTVDLPAAPPRPESIRVPRAKPSATLIALVILAIASVGFGAFGVARGVNEWRSGSMTEARSAATDAAASASEKIFSYRYNELDKHLRVSEATMTPQFAKKFRSISPALKALAPQRKIQVKAVVRYAAAKECGDNCSPRKATVLIFIDQARAAAGDDRPTVFGNRIEVAMVDRNGRWLVNNIKAL
jgi:hypothetical protein